MENRRNSMRLLPIFGCIDATGCAYPNVVGNTAKENSPTNFGT